MWRSALDVGSSHPGAGAGPKGMAVRHLRGTDGFERRETVGPYLLWWRFEGSCF